MERDARVMPRAGAVNVTDEVPLPVEDLIVGDREDDALALELLELVVLEVLVSDAGDPDVLSELREPMLSGVSLEEGHGERLLEARRARLRDAVVAESPLRVNVRLTRVEDTNLRAVVQAQRAAQGLVRLTGVQDRGAVAELHRALETVLGGGRRRRNQRQREEGRQQARHRGGGVEEVWEGAGRSVKGVHERGRGAAGLNGGRCKPGRQVFSNKCWIQLIYPPYNYQCFRPSRPTYSLFSNNGRNRRFRRLGSFPPSQFQGYGFSETH